MPSAGKRFGTTRIFQPGVLAPPPLRPYTRISGGVLPSAPGQKGQFFGPVTRTLTRRKSVGRLPRSVEMMTQRPVMGSLRNSGKASLLELDQMGTRVQATARYRALYLVWRRVLQLRAKTAA